MPNLQSPQRLNASVPFIYHFCAISAKNPNYYMDGVYTTNSPIISYLRYTSLKSSIHKRFSLSCLVDEVIVLSLTRLN